MSTNKCLHKIDVVESLLIICKRGNRIIKLGNKQYEDDDSRVQVEDTANGNTLVIRLSEEKDAGEYVCQVSAAQPVELKHTVKIVGKAIVLRKVVLMKFLPPSQTRSEINPSIWLDKSKVWRIC